MVWCLIGLCFGLFGGIPLGYLGSGIRAEWRRDEFEQATVEYAYVNEDGRSYTLRNPFDDYRQKPQVWGVVQEMTGHAPLTRRIKVLDSWKPYKP